MCAKTFSTVEISVENPRVGSSILPLATILQYPPFSAGPVASVLRKHAASLHIPRVPGDGLNRMEAGHCLVYTRGV